MVSQSLDLGLSLGLTSPNSLSSSTSFAWNTTLNSIVDREVQPAAEEQTSSPGSALSSGSGKRAERELADFGPRGAGSDEEDGCDANGRKKLRLSKDQAAVLEECFKTHSTLNPKQKLALANSLNLRPRQVEVWFQNRRARTKLKQTEVDCEYLKRWCERLSEENRRLEKEVAELRAFKAASPSMLQSSAGAAPLTTLTMCPSCQRVESSPNNAHNPSANIVAASIAAANVTSSSTFLPSHRQFFCRRDSSAYGSSTGFAKVVKAAR